MTTHWLWDSIREEKLKSFDPYLIRPPRIESQFFDSELLEKATKDEGKNRSPKKIVMENGEAVKKRSLVGRTPDIPMNEIMTRQDNILDTPLKKSKDAEAPKDQVAIPGEQSQTNNPAHAPTVPSIPLREISFNSSPPKPTIPSPLKSEIRPEYDDNDSIGPVISSLLAHHQRSAANSASNTTAEAPKINRRRRQLLGRAPSGISVRSSESIGISRASSVDTINTDGLGTPLESSNSHTRNRSSGVVALWAYGEQQEAAWDAADDHLQMTQLSYEDPNVQIWRERVVEKLGGAKEIEPDKAAERGKRAESIGVVRDVVSKGMQAVAKRTRQALGR